MKFPSWTAAWCIFPTTRLLTVNADGSNRAMIFDGGAMDEINPFLTSIRGPGLVAGRFDHCLRLQGLEFVLHHRRRTIQPRARRCNAGDGWRFRLPGGVVLPEMYSADGSKLISHSLITKVHPLRFIIQSGALVRLSGRRYDHLLRGLSPHPRCVRAVFCQPVHGYVHGGAVARGCRQRERDRTAPIRF
jgi:hypothetical protein